MWCVVGLVATFCGCSSLARSCRTLGEYGSSSGLEGFGGRGCLISMFEASTSASRSWVFMFAVRTKWMEAVAVMRPFCCGVRQIRSPNPVARVLRFL